MTSLSNLKVKIASCKDLIKKADKLIPPARKPGAGLGFLRGEKPPPPSPETALVFEQLRAAANDLNEALAPALREYDSLVEARKETVHEALISAIKPFFGNEIDELGNRQIRVIHVPLRDCLNEAFSRTFSPSFFHPELTPENLVEMCEQHVRHMEQWSSVFGWKL